MRKMLNVALLVLLSVLLAGTSFGQAVTYTGKLQIGFGDQDNVTGFRSNNAIPICAGQGELVNPGTIGTTLGTLPFNQVGDAAPGVGGAMTFNAVTPTGGGAQEKDNSTCNVAIPGFANPRLRSRTQVGAAHFPGRKGPFTTDIINQPVPANPTATYMLSAMNGNEQAGVVTAWTTMATDMAPAVNYSGLAISSSVPFLGAGNATMRIQPAAGRFGGGMPFSGGGGVQLGINFETLTPGGTNMLMPGDYGLVLYANGFLPTDPQIMGTDATGVNILNPVTTMVYGTNPNAFAYTIGLINGRQDLSFVARTRGGPTQNMQGAIRTVLGGNTQTPAAGGPGPQIASAVAFTGIFGEWTTGQVTWTDKVGDFFTIRRATGSDVASASAGGATRRLQVVAPWGATIRPVGSFGLPVPTLGFGGIAKLDVRVIPAPEPGTLAMLGFGVAGLIGLSGAARRRNG